MAGAGAGLAVDLTLFPLDTLKTRLQSRGGFFPAGGFGRLYAGASSVAIGSAPGAALFFATYESAKIQLAGQFSSPHLLHATSASLGEIVACLVRVPTEVIKQNAQIYPRRSVWYISRLTMSAKGLQGFYRGYWSTIFREIPFSLIQFPIWESLKLNVAKSENRAPTSMESAVCGSVAGMIAASVTTPLDVAKTRIMTADISSSEGNVYRVLGSICREEGFRSLWLGLVPRTLWMGLGGFIFFGAYELMLVLVSPWGVRKASSTTYYAGNVQERFLNWAVDAIGERPVAEERKSMGQLEAEAEAVLQHRSRLQESEQRIALELERRKNK